MTNMFLTMTNMFLDNDKYVFRQWQIYNVSRSNFRAKSFSGQSFRTWLNYNFAPKAVRNDEGNEDDDADFKVDVGDYLDDGYCGEYDDDSEDDGFFLMIARMMVFLW